MIGRRPRADRFRIWTTARGMRTISAPVFLQPKRWWPLLAAAATLAAARASDRAADPPPTLEILFHADLDGRFASPRCGKPGAARRTRRRSWRRCRRARTQRARRADLAGRQLGGARSLRRRAAGSGRGARGCAGRAVLAGRATTRSPSDTTSWRWTTPRWTALLPRLAAAGLPLLATNLTCDATPPGLRGGAARAADPPRRTDGRRAGHHLSVGAAGHPARASGRTGSDRPGGGDP